MKTILVFFSSIVIFLLLYGINCNAQQHFIGQKYGGGIIFSLDGTGEHGLIAALFDQPRYTCWGANGWTGANLMNEGTSNTEKIVSYMKNKHLLKGDGVPAACMCDTLKLEGYDDWFLPSINELKDMYDKPLSHLDDIIKEEITKYFKKKNLTTIESLKSSNSLLDQVKVLAAIDYYSNKVLWTKSNFYLAEDERWTFKDELFFLKNRLLYNVQRYIGDGNSNRVLADMKLILNNENKIISIIDIIQSFENSQPEEKSNN